jgi:serine/threonine protein kinase
METSWKEKYDKYKKKYLQEAGKLTFSDCKKYSTNCISPRILLKSTKENKLVSLESASTQFSPLQEQTIQSFIKNFLPYVKYNGKFIGNVETDLQVMGAGTFGVTIYAHDLLIKIIKLYEPNDSQANITSNLKLNASEISVLHDLMSIQTPKNNIMPNYYGYVSTNKDFPQYVQRGSSRKYGSFHVSIPAKDALITFDTPLVDFPIDNKLLFVFQHKATMSATDFFKNNTDVFHVADFIVSMIFKLHELHMKSNYIHQDLKLDNLVYDKKLDQFQIIDFGLSVKFTPKQNYILASGGTPPYFQLTTFQKYRSFYYDWFCLYLMILSIFQVARPAIVRNTVAFQFYNLPSEFSSLNNVVINEYGKTVEEQQKIRDLHHNLISKQFTKSQYFWTFYDILNLLFESKLRQPMSNILPKYSNSIIHDIDGNRISINIPDQTTYEDVLFLLIRQDLTNIKKIFNIIPKITPIVKPQIDQKQKQEEQVRQQLEQQRKQQEELLRKQQLEKLEQQRKQEEQIRQQQEELQRKRELEKLEQQRVQKEQLQKQQLELQRKQQEEIQRKQQDEQQRVQKEQLQKQQIQIPPSPIKIQPRVINVKPKQEVKQIDTQKMASINKIQQLRQPIQMERQIINPEILERQERMRRREEELNKLMKR